MRTRLSLLLALVLLWPPSGVPVQAQTANWRSASGNLDAVSECVDLNTLGMGTGVWSVQGTYAGTVTFYVTIGANNSAIDVSTPDGGTAVNSTTSTGSWVGSVAGWQYMRACMTAYTSGTANITLTSSVGGGATGGTASGDSIAPAVTTVSSTDLVRVGVFNAADTQITTFVPNQVTEGSSFSAGSQGILAGAVRVDTPSAGTGVANGDVAHLSVDANGSLRTVLSSGGSDVTLSTDSTEDAQEAGGETGPVVLGVRRDAAASSAGATGDFATFNTDAAGLMWTRQLDPCSGVAKTFYVVNISTATTVEIANAVASQFFYICSVNLVAGGADGVAIAEDDTDGCGSLTAGLHGGVTGATGWSFAANGGIALGNGSSSVMKTSTAARYLCLITSQAVQVSGTIAYVSAP